MAKFSGMVGFEIQKETEPGVWSSEITEHKYRGDILNQVMRREGTDKVNEDINISNQISIVANAYANRNIEKIRYVIYMGTKWKVTSVEVQFPRLILSVGGVYND